MKSNFRPVQPRRRAETSSKIKPNRCCPCARPTICSTLITHRLLALGFGFRKTSMQRFTARLLLVFAIAGSLVPLAPAAVAPPLHSCCLRNGTHQCHGSAAPDQRSIRDTSCCNHDCWRVAATSQWASPQATSAAIFVQNVSAFLIESPSRAPFARPSTAQSTRAPPGAALA